MECNICRREFNNKLALLQHVENTHGRSGVHRGAVAWENNRNQCREITTNSNSLDYHYEVTDDMYDDDTNTWDCGACRREFRTRNDLYKHMTSGTHEQARYKCQGCNKLFTSLASLKQHLQSTGHSSREERLVDVMVTDGQRAGMLMITNGAANYNECTLYFDGSAIPNPCEVAGCGWRLLDHRDFLIVEDGTTVTEMYGEHKVTSNQAEYMGLINGMQAAIDEGVKRIEICGDSELVINQMTGDYHCGAVRLIPLHRRAKALERNFQEVSYKWIPRHLNTECDEIARNYAGGY